MLNTTLYGQSCSGGDVIMSNITFPQTNVDEMIKFNEIGAYSGDALSGHFNGYDGPYSVFYVSQRALHSMERLPKWPRLKAFLKSEPFAYYERRNLD